MKEEKLVALVVSGLVFSGCQSLDVRDIESLPPPAAIPETSEQGTVEVRFFNDISGNDIINMTELARFPDNPDEVVKLNRLEVSPNRDENYGSLVRGYIEPPDNGRYRFFLSGDDETRFRLSTDQSVDNARVIATVPSWSSFQQFDKFSSQSSPFVDLQAGKRYFFEILHKEGIGGDHFSVAWEGPGFSRSIVDGQFLYTVSQSDQLYPDDLMAERAYKRGYRAGFFDGSESLAFNPGYPPKDEDQDGLYDNWEVKAGLDPSSAGDAESDQDLDLLTATDEYLLGTNPEMDDTDGDGIPDGAEVAFGLDPLDSADAVEDIDADGFSNLEEYQANTDMTDATDLPVVDVPSERVAGSVGQYFDGRNLDQFVFARQDNDISNDWGRGAPLEGFPVDNFSVRWLATLVAPHDDGRRDYRFRATRDDGIRIYLDGELIIDAWLGTSAIQYSSEAFSLSAGESRSLTVEFSEVYGNASLSVELVDLSTGAVVSPESAYFTPPMDARVSEDTDGDSIPDLWEMLNGTDAWRLDGSSVYNSQGVTSLQAYQSDLNPWTLETVTAIDSYDGGGSNESDGESGGDSEGGDDGTGAGTDDNTTVQTLTVTWTPPGTREDGTSIALSEIQSYQINYGLSRENMNQSVSVPQGVNTYTFEGLEAGSWFFSIRVQDDLGNWSDPTEIVTETIE